MHQEELRFILKAVTKDITHRIFPSKTMRLVSREAINNCKTFHIANWDDIKKIDRTKIRKKR